MRRRVWALIALVACAALGVLAYRWSSARCSERRLSAALAGIEGAPLGARPVLAAQAILDACPVPSSRATLSHLIFLRSLDQAYPEVFPAALPEPELDELWRAVCPRGPTLQALDPPRARGGLQDACELDRLGVLTREESIAVEQDAVRTWTLYPWLRSAGVSHEVTRELMRALLLWPGWSRLRSAPVELELPQAISARMPWSGYVDGLIVLGGQIRHGAVRIDIADAGWRRELADVLAGLVRDADGGRWLDIYADASVRGEVLRPCLNP